MPNADTRRNIQTLSYWGNCRILRDKDGCPIAIISDTGKVITPKRKEETHNRIEQEKPRQISIPGTDNLREPLKYADPNLFMPPNQREGSERTPETTVAMATAEVRRKPRICLVCRIYQNVFATFSRFVGL